MEAEDAFSMDMMGPSAEDRANGAALLSAAFIGELPRLYHGVAFALIVGGIVVSSRR